MAVTRVKGRPRKAAASFTDFEHTGPGTLAGRFLRSAWQPIHRSQDLPVGRAKIGRAHV